MMATRLTLEDRLDGAVNFSPWKDMIVLILQENELCEIVNNIVAHPVTIPTVAAHKVTFDKGPYNTFFKEIFATFFQ